MLKLADKIFVSYPGGGGGDMFAASMNGFDLLSETHIAVKNIPFSIKHFEKDIEQKITTLESAVSNVDFKYVTTHLIDKLPVNSLLLVFNNQSLTTIIQRQMQIQTLTLELNTGTFSKIIQSLCAKQQWERAATVWFNFAKERAVALNKKRLESTMPKLDFSHVLSTQFVDSLVLQGWSERIDLLRHNHSNWLKKQPVFSDKETINSIALKLKSMDWSTSSGTIKYEHKH